MSDDLISRQAAIEAVEPYTDDVYNSTAREIKEALQTLPSVQQKTGYWIWKKRRQHYAEKYVLGVNAFLEERFPVTESSLERHKAKVYVHHNYEEERNYCSECGKLGADTFFNYCPNCGAKMDGGNDNG